MAVKTKWPRNKQRAGEFVSLSQQVSLWGKIRFVLPNSAGSDPETCCYCSRTDNTVKQHGGQRRHVSTRRGETERGLTLIQIHSHIATPHSDPDPWTTFTERPILFRALFWYFWTLVQPLDHSNPVDQLKHWVGFGGTALQCFPFLMFFVHSRWPLPAPLLWCSSGLNSWSCSLNHLHNPTLDCDLSKYQVWLCHWWLVSGQSSTLALVPEP